MDIIHTHRSASQKEFRGFTPGNLLFPCNHVVCCNYSRSILSLSYPIRVIYANKCRKYNRCFSVRLRRKQLFLLRRGVRAVRTETNIYKAQFRSVEFYDRMHILIRLNLVQVFNFLLKTDAGTKQSRKVVFALLFFLLLTQSVGGLPPSKEQ